MPFFICVKCQNSCSIDTHNKTIRPALCGPFQDGSMIAPVWLTPPEHRDIIDQYCDPMGEPYKGLTEFIQTPMTDPVRPVMTASPKIAEQLRQEKEVKTRFDLRDLK